MPADPPSAVPQSTIVPPEQFTFTKPAEWPKWIRRYGRYRIASGLDKKSDDIQVNSLLYTMGDEADDVMISFVFDPPEDSGKYDKVKEKFDSHFVVKRNTIYERAKFNQRVQGTDELVEAFITELYCLVEYCEYGILRDEMIRDRLVVGLQNSKLSEKMQMDAKLTLEKAVNMARQSESVHKQQEVVRGATSSGELKNVDAIKTSRFKKQEFGRRPPSTRPSNSAHKPTCQRCGNAFHNRNVCPARDITCHNCGREGHFARVCKSTKLNEIRGIENSDSEDDSPAIFLGEISDTRNDQGVWETKIAVNGKLVTFKLDSGADVSVIPSEIYTATPEYGPLKKATKRLYGPCRYRLECRGKFTATLRYQEKSYEEEIYVIKDLEKPLLSRYACDALRVIAKVAEIRSAGDKQQYVQKHPRLFKGLGCLEGEYKIITDEDVQPFNLTTPRRIPIPQLPCVKEEIRRMEELGVIEQIDEPTAWCSPMVIVPKSNGKVRICGDFIQLNKAVQRENHPMPTTEQTLGKLAGAKVVSKLDANSGFWQRKLAAESKKLTTFITPWGRYCYTRLPFGISSAPEHFQRTIQRVLEGLEGVECQVDDLLVYGKDQAEHDERLEAVLKRLEQANVTLNLEKCEFSKDTVVFLGNLVGKHGIQVDPRKVSAVQDMKEPTDISELRRFLGMANQLGKYIPHLASINQPLRDLLNQKNAWLWGDAQQEAFDRIKHALVSAPSLAIYDPARETTVSADASSYGLGAVLTQKQDDGERKAVAFISRSLTPVERRYAQIEKEALATTWACERLSDYLVGKSFHIETDHKPLVPILGSKNLDEMPPRIQRLRMRLMKFHYTISHVPGKQLVTADTLSRAPVESSPSQSLQEEINLYVDSVLAQLPASDIRLREIRERQEEDEVCQQLAEYTREGWPDKHRVPSAVKPYWSVRGEITMAHGLLLKSSRIIIPSSLRLEMLDCIHEGHQGITKCRQRTKSSIWWPGLSRQLEDMIQACRKCAEHRVQRPEPLIPSAVPDRPWQVLGTDLFTLKGRTYLLVIDYRSRYVEVSILLSSQTSREVIRALKSMFSRHGIPEVVRSDNGPQYDSAEFTKFAKDWGFQHITSSPRYAQSNGEVERSVQTVKNLLKKEDDPAKALMAYRSTPLECGYSPAQLLFGRKLRTTVPTTPAELAPKWPDLGELKLHEEEMKQRQSDHFNTCHRARPLSELAPGEQVWIRDMKLPATTVQKTSLPRSYIVQTTAGTPVRRNRRDLVSLNPATTPEAENPMQPCPRKPVVSTSVSSPGLAEAPSSLKPVVTTRAGRHVKPPTRLDL